LHRLFQKECLGRPYFQEPELGLKSDFTRGGHVEYRIARVRQSQHRVGGSRLHARQKTRHILDVGRILLIEDDFEPGLLQRGHEKLLGLEGERQLIGNDGDPFGADLRQQLRQVAAEGIGLHLGKPHVFCAEFADQGRRCGRTDQGEPVTLDDGRDGDMSGRSPRCQQKVDLVDADQLFVDLRRLRGLRLIVIADEFDRTLFLSSDAQAAGRVHLLAPQLVLISP
jgi:hypothetical protein